jgi:hypothetical protein
VEHIAHQTIVFAQKQPAIMAGDDTGSVLAAMLEYGKRVIQRLIDVRLTDDADDATHATNPYLVNCGNYCARLRRVESRFKMLIGYSQLRFFICFRLA